MNRFMIELYSNFSLLIKFEKHNTIYNFQTCMVNYSLVDLAKFISRFIRCKHEGVRKITILGLLILRIKYLMSNYTDKIPDD